MIASNQKTRYYVSTESFDLTLIEGGFIEWQVLSLYTNRAKSRSFYMFKTEFSINNIPAVLWGEKSSKLFIAVHGNMSNKCDDPIIILAEEAVPLGYQVLSFDLPKHGDRLNEPTLCKVQNCVSDLSKVIEYAKTISLEISLFACSMGAYFSLLTYKEELIKQSLFLSPVVDMKRLIDNMMTWFNVSEERLKTEKEICTPAETLYWDYYCYVKDNPIIKWNSPTAVLYGEKDAICEYESVSSFANQFNCELKVMETGEHYFHTPEQLSYLRLWIQEHLRR